MENNLDFETFLNEINTEDNNDNDYYNGNYGIEIFENFLDRIYDMIDNNNNPEDFYIFGDDDDDNEIDNLLDLIEEDKSEQNAGAIEADL
jgi:hypothetical protein